MTEVERPLVQTLAESLSGSMSAVDADLARDQEERMLDAARASFPRFRVVEVFGGYAALPADVELIQSTTLDGLVKKLRERSQ